MADFSLTSTIRADGLSVTANGSEMSIPSALGPAHDAASDSGTSSWLGLLVWFIITLIQFASSCLYFIIRLSTITVPTFIFSLLSTSWTVTMNATTLMVIMAAVASVATWIVRYRILNMYSRLPPEPQRKEPDIDLFPDSHEEGVKPGLSNYLDEFLSAIKIFGYLERPVFHELTRSMQTRKLIAGETINLEEEKGFCIVVDGFVEIFVKSGRASRSDDTSLQPRFDSAPADENDGFPSAQQYQLLTEVKNGAPMSSLFSIMSLFTEDVRLRETDEDTPEPNAAHFEHKNHQMGRGMASRAPSHPSSGSYPGTPHLDANEEKQSSRQDEYARPVMGSNAGSRSRIPSLSLASAPTHQFSSTPDFPDHKPSSSAHPDIIARATVDTTVAIIPASAFRRLTKVYPKATSHIVQVILSRFQRVTLATAYSYLGLSDEVLQTEKSMNQYTMCQLPNLLRGDALSRLKTKFAQERQRLGIDADGKGIVLHNANARRQRQSRTTLRQDARMHPAGKEQRTPASATTMDHSLRGKTASAHTPSPGDLLSNLHLARVGHRPSSSVDFSYYPDTPTSRRGSPSLPSRRSIHPFTLPNYSRVSIGASESTDEDGLFRTSILECMFKAMGLNAAGGGSREPESVEGSPKLPPYDQRRQKAVMGSNNAFGIIGPFEGADGDTESVTSSSITLNNTPSAQTLAHDMRDELEIVFFPKDSVLVEQGERSPGLYYVIDGFLDICTASKEHSADIFRTAGRSSLQSGVLANHGSSSDAGQRTGERNKKCKVRQSVSLIKPGGLAGYISTVSSYRSFIDIVAKTDVYVGFLPRSSLDRIVDRYPIVLLTMAKRLTSLLPRLLLHIDFALDWDQVNAGQVIFHDGDESEAIYIVLNGRLRLVEDRKGGGHGVTARAEFGQGDSVGELEVLTESARSGTLHAIRETELVRFPRSLFNSLAQEHPNITIKISKIIASRMRSLVDDPSPLMTREVGASASLGKGSSALNLRTVAILPVTSGVPVVEFGSRLMNALAQVGPSNGAKSLNQSAILNHLGKHAFNKMGKLKLSQYLADLEEKYGLVVYVADTNVNSPWTQTCISQADCILLVGLAEGSPEIGEYERFMLGMKSTARKILVLLHAERYSTPGLARSWLRNRMWINGGHYHVQMEFRANIMPVHSASKRPNTTLKERVQILQAEIQKYASRKLRHTPFYYPDAPFKGDFHRLARRLCGKSVGLVLGGGGARGITQIGIIRAMEEAGIPIDIVGGTSIGSFIGALYARHADVVPIYGLAKKFSGRMASIWRFALDLTYPTASYTTGHEFNRGIFKTFGKDQIEDFWLEFYCNTTNISKSRIEYHTSGYAWRYIRASMSLAGLVPPLADEGSMLLDGGYIDNLTVSHMKRLGVDTIFAVDVGSLDDDTPQAYGDSLSGVWAFFNRWNPFSSTPNPPTLAEIQARLAYVSSVDALERAKTMPGCIYMRPPVDEYGTLDFGKFDEIYKVGYEYGTKFLRRLRDQGVLPLVEETEAKKALRRTMAPRRASI
ncbi:patatin-like phospholipase [Sodiomyces alkalinus F11]|uniref:Lysophospholipase NTE1 n=1 Tax=Sodiomyces alkalinus (strain CBS 110278 / VKM F-3762 / F11) TaxID=1314773 RepID=A0A3N2Q500_SODAK|nr:patatin-like phospholipase [Sodiomyces alkalinus F11]ROT41777.1 patatin-like phospholipase [Sodiomyces alkalinus F11]